eukprot:SAG11_NODE_14908_length_595_cov_1.256048_1_plen_153_part_10
MASTPEPSAEGEASDAAPVLPDSSDSKGDESARAEESASAKNKGKVKVSMVIIGAVFIFVGLMSFNRGYDCLGNVVEDTGGLNDYGEQLCDRWRGIVMVRIGGGFVHAGLMFFLCAFVSRRAWIALLMVALSTAIIGAWMTSQGVMCLSKKMA